MARTLQEVQTRLNRSASTNPKLVLDGEKGPATTAAVVAFQKANNIRETGIVDEATLAKLFPEDIPKAKGSSTIQATVTDWVLNYAQSKIVWAAGALAAAIAVWVNTKLGLDLPPALADTVTQLLSWGGLALIAILRGWAKDTGRVAGKTPPVIQKPAEYVGQKM
jgi:hypothetical protein